MLEYPEVEVTQKQDFKPGGLCMQRMETGSPVTANAVGHENPASYRKCSPHKKLQQSQENLAQIKRDSLQLWFKEKNVALSSVTANRQGSIQYLEMSQISFMLYFVPRHKASWYKGDLRLRNELALPLMVGGEHKWKASRRNTSSFP